MEKEKDSKTETSHEKGLIRSSPLIIPFVTTK